MSSLKKWEDKMKLARANTPFRDFVKEMASNIPVVLYNWKWETSRYPDTPRIKVYPTKLYEEMKDDLIKNWISYDFSLDFFKNYKRLIPIAWAPYIYERSKCWKC